MSDDTIGGKARKRARPLSPHLQIYKPIPSMMMSIAHRITGVGLYFGMAFVAWWLLAVASGEDAFDVAAGIFGSFIGLVVIFLLTFALIHHMLGGLRHFAWDFGKLMDKKTAREISIATPVISGGLTLVIFILGLVTF